VGSQAVPHLPHRLLCYPGGVWLGGICRWHPAERVRPSNGGAVGDELASADTNTINRVIQYNTIELSGLTALDFFTGATGTLFVNWIQQRWKLKSKTMLLYGASMTVLTELWGAIGAFTNVIGFHHRMRFPRFNLSIVLAG
jgi:hypothetical protein